MNEENEKQFEVTQQSQRDERFERKTFESESFLVKKQKSKEPPKDVFNSLLTDANIYKPKFKPKTLTVSLPYYIRYYVKIFLLNKT